MSNFKNFLLSPQSPSYLLILFLMVFLMGCEKDSLPEQDNAASDLNLKAPVEKVNTFYGPAQPLGNGVARSMVTMTHSGEPVAIGVKISEKALERLPDHMQVLTLKLPNKTEGLAIDHVDLDWNPHGHDPLIFYSAPHFDIHFYMVSPEEKMQFTDPEKGVAVPLPPEDYWPANYVPTGELVPQMGMHWINLLAPEFNGGEFSHTFIYGSYDAQFVFYEPMITMEHLRDRINGTYDIAQPKIFQRPGFYYPTTYSITYDEKKKEYIISMEGMVER